MQGDCKAGIIPCRRSKKILQDNKGGIEQFLSDHEFKLSDGTIIQSRPMTKVMNPDKTKVLICYGGLRVDGCSLVVQTAISRWESLYSFESPEAAVDALKTVTEAIEQRVSLIEL